MKPDLSKIRKLTLAEIAERRHLRAQGKRIPKPPKKRKQNKHGTQQSGRKVVIASISIRPELKIQAERYIGKGNFSKAVTIALTQMILKIMEKADGYRPKA